MSDETEKLRAFEAVHLEGRVISGVSGESSIIVAGHEIEIEVEDAAHRRDMEKQRVQRELDSDKRAEDEKYKDRHHQRIRDNCTFGVVIVLIMVGLAGSFYVAVTATDPSLQTWAQGLTTTIAGVVGGAFAGYLIGDRR